MDMPDTAAGHRPNLEVRAAEAQAQGYESCCVVKLAYKGTNFNGFAYQPAQTTVEGELLSAFTTLLHREPELVCAGRTDAGVHALAQYVSVPLYAEELSDSRDKLMRALDGMTSYDIAILDIYRGSLGFSARFDALSRSYVYRIVTGSHRPVLLNDYVWWQRAPLDTQAMGEALNYLVGEHDFKSFCKLSSAQDKSTVREILDASVSLEREFDEDLIAIRLTGTAFLHSMVRTIVGTLAEVGLHKREPAWMRDVLEAQDRSAAGQTAPAGGLCLCDVAYPQDLLSAW